MRQGKYSVALLGLAGLTLMLGCGGKKEEAAPATTSGTTSDGMAKPPPGIAEQIKNNPNIPADQKAKYGGGGK